MKLRQRLARLEEQFVTEPTILFMPDGELVTLTGPNDYPLTLLGVATQPERATSQQAAHLDLIRNCIDSKEPGGAHLVDLIRCVLTSPAGEVA